MTREPLRIQINAVQFLQIRWIYENMQVGDDLLIEAISELDGPNWKLIRTGGIPGRGTNPETCLHNIMLQVSTPFDTVRYNVCASCDSTLDPEFVKEKNYQHDIGYGVWVHVPARRN